MYPVIPVAYYQRCLIIYEQITPDASELASGTDLRAVLIQITVTLIPLRHLHLDVPNGIFTDGFRPETLYQYQLQLDCTVMCLHSAYGSARSLCSLKVVVLPTAALVLKNATPEAGEGIIWNEHFPKTALFWAITQRVVVIPYRRFRATYRSIKDSWPLKNETRCPETSGKELPLHAA